MSKKLSIKEKLVAGICAVAALGAIVVLVILLTGGKTSAPNNNNNNDNPDTSQTGDNTSDNTDLPALIAALPDQTALNNLHSQLSDFWISGNNFVGFTSIGGAPAIYYGLYQTEYGMQGKIIGARAVRKNEVEFTILIPFRPATEMNDERPERAVTVSVDVSNFNDKRLNIKIADLGNDEWLTYEFGGATLMEAYNE
ncbi:hypothetical protein FWF74_03715 [Candidatus Saccharibacteria bacterium]|nr:hypothetical protein [Candidatus Saccharibacteria bacterium]MCL1962985.1 hypothetical protein [Candidatus Saccharibacteria bacterium]